MKTIRIDNLIYEKIKNFADEQGFTLKDAAAKLITEPVIRKITEPDTQDSVRITEKSPSESLGKSPSESLGKSPSESPNNQEKDKPISSLQKLEAKKGEDGKDIFIGDLDWYAIKSKYFMTAVIPHERMRWNAHSTFSFNGDEKTRSAIDR